MNDAVHELCAHTEMCAGLRQTYEGMPKTLTYSGWTTLVPDSLRTNQLPLIFLPSLAQVFCIKYTVCCVFFRGHYANITWVIFMKALVTMAKRHIWQKSVHFKESWQSQQPGLTPCLASLLLINRTNAKSKESLGKCSNKEVPGIW